MAAEEASEMPLCLDNDEWVLKPLNKLGAGMAHSAASSVSNHSLLGHSSQKLSSESQKTHSLGNRSGKDVPVASVTAAKQKSAPAAKKKFKVKKFKYCCYACECVLTPGDHRSHHLGKQHMKKAVPKIKSQFSITVMNFNSNITEGVLYDYFSIVGTVDTVFIHRGKVLYAVIKFAERCSVGHAAERLTAHVLKGSKLTLIKGLPFGKEVLKSQSGTSPNLENVSFPEKFTPEIDVKAETCRVCNILLDAGNIRKHYLSGEHTKRAYFQIRAKFCVNVTGFRDGTSEEALYDYFSLPGRVVTLILFQKKKICALVEFSKKCSVEHVVKCLVPHRLGNAKLTVSAGLPFGERKIADLHEFLCGDFVPLAKNLTARLTSTQEKSVVAKEKKNAGKQAKSIVGTEQKGTKKAKSEVVLACHVCHATFRAARRRHHYLSQAHVEKSIPCMRERSCVTVSGFPVENTMEILYDYFSSFEAVRTIDTRRQKQGLAVVEFESRYPLPNILEYVTTLAIGNITLTVIRGFPSPEIPDQSPTSHVKEEGSQTKRKTNKTLGCGVGSQPSSSVKCIPDRIIQSEFENALKSLRIQESRVETVVENQVANSTKSSNTNGEIKKVETKPLFCDVCNVFYNPDHSRDHHTSKKHNEKAIQFMKEKCCISVKGFPKDTKLQALYDCFIHFGKVKAVVIHRKKELLAIVEFYDEKSARDALKTKEPHMLKDRRLNVGQGHPKYNGGMPLESLPSHNALMSSLQKYKTVNGQMSFLQSSILLSEKNMQARIQLCKLVREVLVYFFPSCALHLFGSSVNSFGLQGSDVDILFEAHSDTPNKVEPEHNYSKSDVKSPSVTEVMDGRFPLADLASLPRVVQLDFIKKVLRKYPHEFHIVMFVPAATCPIVKFISARYGLSCDLSNGNRLSLCNTGLLRCYGRLDKRVIPLVTTLRYWAKRYNYIHSRNFSSYAFTWLVIFFLQTREPYILPSVNVLRSKTDIKIDVDGIDCSFCSDPEKIKPSVNSQSLESLLWEFFAYYGKFDYSKYVISPLTGNCEPVEHFTSSKISSPSSFKVSPVCIQDPFLTSRNVSSFVKEGALAQMTDHLRKISREHYDYYQKLKSKANPCSSTWGIPELFDVMPKQLKSKAPKKDSGVNSFTMVKIALSEEVLDGVQKKHEISCTQCVSVTEIAVHEVCSFVIGLMRHTLLFNVEITADKINHHEWETKVKTVNYVCSCGGQRNNTSDVDDDVQNEKLGENLLEMENISMFVNVSNSSVSGGIQDEELTDSSLETNGDLNGSNVSGVKNEELTEDSFETNGNLSGSSVSGGAMQNEEELEDCLDTNGNSCSPNSTMEVSSDEHSSDEENAPETVKMPDELADVQNVLPEGRSSKFFDVKEHKPFLCFKFTAAYQTWTYRNKYKKQCNRLNFQSILEFERCISRKISEDKTLKLETPAEFACEFYNYQKGSQSVLFLKVTPPELKRCWKPLTSFLKLYLPKMVESHL